jgi:hypothetical protein
VLDEVRSFARQRPGAFLAIALGAGILAGRLARGLAADPDEIGNDERLRRPAPSARRTPGYVARPAVDYDRSNRQPAQALPGGRADVGGYGSGRTPDWAGQNGSDVLGDFR